MLSRLSPEEVNATDFAGRTALSWAARRRDLIAVNTLLEHGADPDIVTPTCIAPLHYACEALNPNCIRPLLSHGADIHITDHNLYNSVHFAIRQHDDISNLVPRIEGGANIEAKTDYDDTPLVGAVAKNNPAIAEYLLDNGSGIDFPAQYGRTPLMYAIKYNSHGCLSLLLRRGANCKVECDAGYGPTIAHIAAEHADLETMRILNKASLSFLALALLEMEGREDLSIEGMVTKPLRQRDGREG